MQWKWLIVASACFCSSYLFANQTTQRIPEFSNDKVSVWKTVVYPAKSQQLVMHHHDNDRVVVALTDGVLRVESNQGQTHLLKLQKDHAYFLAKDPANEMHTDENIGKQPVKVIVVELK